MRPIQIISILFAVVSVFGTPAQAQSTKAQLQAQGAELGKSSLTSGNLTPQALAGGASQGANNVFGPSYTGSADKTLTNQSNAGSMIGIGNAARSKTLTDFKRYDRNRDDQATQANYFLIKTPVLKPTITPDDPMIVAPHSGLNNPVFASSTSKDCKQIDVTTALDPSIIYSCLETYNAYAIPCSVVTDTKFSDTPGPQTPATIDSYACSSSQVLSGATCTSNSTSTTSATQSLSCPAGQTFDGTMCNGTGTTQQLTCNPGQKYQVSMSDSSGMGGDRCQGGDALWAEWTCTAGDYPTITMATNSKPWGTVNTSIPAMGQGQVNVDGYCHAKMVSSTSCTNGQCNGTFTMILGSDSPIYGPYPSSCTSGMINYDGGQYMGMVNEDGTECFPPIVGTEFSEHSYGAASRIVANGQFSISQTVTTTSSNPPTISYTCPAGTSQSGTDCIGSTATSVAAIPNYACPSGYTLSGNICIGRNTDTMAENLVNGCGALEGLSN